MMNEMKAKGTAEMEKEAKLFREYMSSGLQIRALKFQSLSSKFPRARTFELVRARSRLHRSQILQVNTRWKALAEIYTMQSFAQLCNLFFFVKKYAKIFC